MLNKNIILKHLISKKKGFQVLYKLNREVYTEAPVYNRKNFRYKYLGTAPLNIFVKHKCS